MGEREMQNGLCSKDRGRSEEFMTVKNQLILVSCLPPKAMVVSGPGQLSNVMSELVALMLSWWSVLMAMVPIIIESLPGAQRLGCHL